MDNVADSLLVVIFVGGRGGTMRLRLNLFKLCLNCRREQDVRIAAQLRLLMESRASSTSVPQVVVVASTNRYFFFGM